MLDKQVDNVNLLCLHVLRLLLFGKKLNWTFAISAELDIQTQFKSRLECRNQLHTTPTIDWEACATMDRANPE